MFKEVKKNINKCQNEKQEHKVDTAESVCKLRTNDNQNARWEKIIKISAKISEIEILKKSGIRAYRDLHYALCIGIISYSLLILGDT